MYYLLKEELASWRTSFAQFNVSVATMNAHWSICRQNCVDSTQASAASVGKSLTWIRDWETWFNPHWDHFSRASSMSLKVCFYPCLWVIAREAQWVPEGKLACLRMLANHLHLALPESPVPPPQGFPLFRVLSDRKTCDRTGRELGGGGWSMS